MLFNSLEFLIFLIVVFLIYWRLKRKQQNLFLIFASYVFYGWWDWRFLSLIIISSCIDFVVGKKVYQAESRKKKKAYLWVSIVANLFILGFFKYFNFFVGSLVGLLSALGFSELSTGTLNIILPVGISFYTFQTMSYAIDIYKGKVEPAKSWVDFFAFVSFFPQLVAGPIERASEFLGQFAAERNFDIESARAGARQMVWGLFKKVVIADNLALVVNQIYGDVYNQSGTYLFVATFFFAFQIYCDFSGYSDIAIGTAKFFGFNLSKNFHYPYFARNISEFWRRWHISLYTWFRDYVYIPLGGSRVKTRLRHFGNILATFSLSGLWHGANWTFVTWGFFHGLLFLPLVYARDSLNKVNDDIAQLRDLPKIIVMFLLVLLSWVFFRSQSISESIFVLKQIMAEPIFFNLSVFLSPLFIKKTIIIGLLVLVEWRQRRYEHALCIERLPKWTRLAIYYALILLIFVVGNFDYQPFIYFQF